MEYRDGYIVEFDALMSMSVDELESVILRISRDEYLNERARKDILSEYLEVRRIKLNRAFRATDENIQKIKEHNESLIRQTREVIQLAVNVRKEENKYMPEDVTKGEYSTLTVWPDLIMPDADKLHRRFGELNDEKSYSIWEVLTSPHLGGALNCDSMLFFINGIWGSEPDVEKLVALALYGPVDIEGEEPTNWADLMRFLAPEKFEDIIIVNPFHIQYEHWHLSMSDILKVKELDYKITLEYEQDYDLPVSQGN